MDFFPDLDTLSRWLLDYGAYALFLFLSLGIVALPIPEETLMVLSGALMSHGKLTITHIIIAALAGSLCGITASYFLGRMTNNFFITKVFRWVGLSGKKLDKVQSWCLRYGKWALLIGYFIPGVRHFSGLSAGMVKISFKEFALFAYTGALLWVTTFLSLGYFFGYHWASLYEKVFHRAF